MARKHYDILYTQTSDFDRAAAELSDRAVSAGGTVVRIVFFGRADDNAGYAERSERLRAICRGRFGDRAPVTGFVAQAPLNGTLAAEVMSTDASAHIVRHGDYAVIDGCEILTGGLHADLGAGIGGQADAVFGRMREILAAEGFAVTDITRQWNYIERITAMAPQGQHYQQFNDARSRFYDRYAWTGGYPAATGIGAQAGGVTVMFDAVKGADENRPVDNPLQVSAHAYSQNVLIDRPENSNRTTPKFERARYVACQDSKTVYISGTAAIRGEASVGCDIIGQTGMTMCNIDTLTGPENLRRHGVAAAARMRYAMLRVYLKRGGDFPAAEAWMREHYPDIPTVYLLADVCRDELLVEIEGIATN